MAQLAVLCFTEIAMKRKKNASLKVISRLTKISFKKYKKNNDHKNRFDNSAKGSLNKFIIPNKSFKVSTGGESEDSKIA